MITGLLNDFDEAEITVVVYNSESEPCAVAAAVDTGFSEALTLPPSAIADLGLSRVDTTRLLLADGSSQFFRVYEAVVLWDEEERIVRVHEADGGALVGMSLLRDHRFCVDVIESGRVNIERIR